LQVFTDEQHVDVQGVLPETSPQVYDNAIIEAIGESCYNTTELAAASEMIEHNFIVKNQDKIISTNVNS